MRSLFTRWEWPIIATASIIIGCCFCGCALSSTPVKAPITLAPYTPIARPDLAPNATTIQTIDRRIADLQGQLAIANADRVAAQREAQEAEIVAWVKWSRWIAGIGLSLCATGAALACWFGLSRIAIPVAGSAAIGCLALLAYAESLRWMAWIAPGLGLVAIIVTVVILIRRRDAALTTTAKLADSFESGSATVVQKLEAKAIQVRAGVHEMIQRARHPIPEMKENP